VSGLASDARARCTRLVVTLVVIGGVWMLARLGGVIGISAGSAVDLGRSVEQTDPALVAAALLRLVGLAAGVYLGGVLAVATLAGLVRWHPLARMSVRLTPAALRRWVLGGASIGLAGGVIATPTPVSATPVERVAASEDAPGDLVESTAVMVKLDEDDSSRPLAVAAATPVAAPAAAADGDTWLVMPGESFWSIAEEILADTGASTRELTAFWQRLIDANRDRLAHPDNPDLLFTGQELIVPEP
jgi:hypothetical protein